MQIEIQNLIPHPLVEQNTSGSEIWKSESIKFFPGKNHLIFSESGKGKTTLLSIIYGIRVDYDGQVSFDGKNIRSIGHKKWSQLRQTSLSYVFQGLNLFDEISAFDNILVKNKLTNHKTEDEIFAMAEMLKIDHLMKNNVRILSYGQKQRVSIIRALCQPFEFIMLDEPFSHLDENTKDLARNLIFQEATKLGAGVILSSLSDKNTTSYHHSYKI